MSLYIYIYIYMERLFLMFLDHTQRRSTVGRTPLDEYIYIYIYIYIYGISRLRVNVICVNEQ